VSCTLLMVLAAGQRLLQAGPNMSSARLRSARNEDTAARRHSQTQRQRFQGMYRIESFSQRHLIVSKKVAGEQQERQHSLKGHFPWQRG